MRFLLVMILFILSTAHAQSELSTQVHDVDLGQNGDEHLVYLSTGQVARIMSDDHQTLDMVKEALKLKSWLSIALGKEREILSLRNIPAPTSETDQSFQSRFAREEILPYQPSILKNLDDARAVFYDARTSHKDSQCFNRAHIWTYEWRTKRNLYSSKAWIFFTRRYIRKYKFEWWFHVAPMVHVVEGDKVKERIMDIKYAKGPLKLKQWSNIFMRDSADCRVVETYSDYANYPESGSCFVMKSSMYYYQPVDLEQREILGTQKTRWSQAEVKHAYQEAFDITL